MLFWPWKQKTLTLVAADLHRSSTISRVFGVHAGAGQAAHNCQVVEMKLKQLVAFLQGVETFEDPKYQLEQYKTGADIAASIVYTIANSYGDFGEKLVADLGCGTGVLGIGAAAMGAAHVIGFDIDDDAIDQAQENAEDLEVIDLMDFVKTDIFQMAEVVSAKSPEAVVVDAGADLGGCNFGAGPVRRRAVVSHNRKSAGASCSTTESGSVAAAAGDDGLTTAAAPEQGATPSPSAVTWHGIFDTVITNPPFGTRTTGADSAFLKAALNITTAEGRIYSLHKSSTRLHFIRLAEGWGVGCELVAQLRFDIPAMYEFHRQESVDVAVDLLRFVKGKAAKDIIARHESIPAFIEDGAAAASDAGKGRGSGSHGSGRGRGGGGRGGGGGSAGGRR